MSARDAHMVQFAKQLNKTSKCIERIMAASRLQINRHSRIKLVTRLAQP